MASTLFGFTQPCVTKEIFRVAIAEIEIESLRSQNRQLQCLLEESQRYQAEVFADLEKMRKRLHEECFSTQFGESVLHSMAYNDEMTCLKQQLLQIQDLLVETRAQLQ
ncbi:hypothetical protein SUGI_0059610 [Cryptomeria japonica]|nr:hypothetical protein SUGI_0059610 [Cryptomeria japonica]